MKKDYLRDGRLQFDGKGLFKKWCDSNSIKKAIKLAREIANLKER